MNAPQSRPAYEVRNLSFPDMDIDHQIYSKVNAWCAEDADRHPFFGSSKAEAEAIRASFEPCCTDTPQNEPIPVGEATEVDFAVWVAARGAAS